MPTFCASMQPFRLGMVLAVLILLGITAFGQGQRNLSNVSNSPAVGSLQFGPLAIPWASAGQLTATGTFTIGFGSGIGYTQSGNSLTIINTGTGQGGGGVTTGTSTVAGLTLAVSGSQATLSGTAAQSGTSQFANTSGTANSVAASNIIGSLTVGQLPAELSTNFLIGNGGFNTTAAGTISSGTAPTNLALQTGSYNGLYAGTSGTSTYATTAGNGGVTSVNGATGAVTGVLTTASASQFAPASQGIQSLTTAGSSGAATFSAGTLNIPTYSSGGGGITIATGAGIISSTSGSTITLNLANTSAPSNQFATGVAGNVLTYAQPSFSNLSGSIATGQLPSGVPLGISAGTNVTTSTSGGIVTINATGGGGGAYDALSPLVVPQVAVTSGTQLSAFGTEYVISGTASLSGTLPSASGNAGKFVRVSVSLTPPALFTLSGGGSALIDGTNPRIMWQTESATVECDGTNWRKVAGKSVPFYVEVNYPFDSAGNNGMPLTAAAFTQFQVSTVVSDVAQLFSVSNNWVTIPRSGRYIIQFNFRPQDGVSLASYGIGSGTSASFNTDQDPYFTWQNTTTGASTNRNGAINVRTVTASQGQNYFGYYYYDGSVSSNSARVGWSVEEEPTW